MISAPNCPQGHGIMLVEYGVEHYGPHFTCHACRKVYVREYRELVECLQPRNHMRHPPPWATKPPAPEVPPLRAHDHKETEKK